MTNTLPPIHAPHVGGNPADTLKDVRSIIEQAITNQPRSLQKQIGPSELGVDCVHCLAAKLAGWEKTETSIPWLPFIGSATHHALETMFIEHENVRTNGNHTASRRWLSEQPVMVGHIGDQEIWGSCDLFNTETGVAIDFKIVGQTTLRSVRNGPSNVYRTQAHLYGKGWITAGYPVDHVAIAYLPRNAIALDAAIWWHEPYDPTIAQTALDRANHLATQIEVLRPLGENIINNWITNLDRAPGCYDCPKYGDAPEPVLPTLDDALGT